MSGIVPRQTQGETDRPERILKRRGAIMPELGVTQKEDGFCRSIVYDHATYSEAYKASHDWQDMSARTISRQASKVAARPRVRDRIAALMREERARNDFNSSAAKAYILDRLMAETKGEKASDRLRALELIGKLDFVGAFREAPKLAPGAGKTATELEAELRDKLVQLLAPKP